MHPKAEHRCLVPALLTFTGITIGGQAIPFRAGADVAATRVGAVVLAEVPPQLTLVYIWTHNKASFHNAHRHFLNCIYAPGLYLHMSQSVYNNLASHVTVNSNILPRFHQMRAHSTVE